eukprot:3874058-Prymnesium_polylepis.1
MAILSDHDSSSYVNTERWSLAAPTATSARIGWKARQAIWPMREPQKSECELILPRRRACRLKSLRFCLREPTASTGRAACAASAQMLCERYMRSAVVSRGGWWCACGECTPGKGGHGTRARCVVCGVRHGWRAVCGALACAVARGVRGSVWRGSVRHAACGVAHAAP